MTQSIARERIQEIIEKFRREQAAGQINQYNESETKTGFIEPLLQALGWNTQDRNEVGLEEKISGGRWITHSRSRVLPRSTSRLNLPGPGSPSQKRSPRLS